MDRAGHRAQIPVRHANYETTLKHDTVLGLEDTAGAVDSLPRVGPSPKDDTLRALDHGWNRPTSSRRQVPRSARGHPGFGGTTTWPEQAIRQHALPLAPFQRGE